MGEDGRAMSERATRPSTLISRPTTGSVPADEPDASRPLATGAALAGAAAAGIGLVVCMSVALTGWFLADAGAHGDTTDALRVGADAWLMGHGSHLVLSGVPLAITPLAVTMMLVMTAFRSGRWAAQKSGQKAGQASMRAGEQRVLAGAAATFTCAYVVVAVV